MLSQAATIDGAVLVIGNAPSALLALLDMIDAGVTRPGLDPRVPGRLRRGGGRVQGRA